MKKASTVVKEMEALANKSKTKKTVVRAENTQRDLWVKSTKEKLDTAITEAAKKGLRSVEYPLNSLIVGAENLKEAAEMCEIFSEVLTEYEYKHAINRDGKFVISW